MDEILEVVFSPFTIFFIMWKNDEYKYPTFISWVCALVFTGIAWGAVGPTAGFWFQVLTGVFSYAFTIYAHNRIKNEMIDPDSLSGFFYFLFAGVTAGYSAGLGWHLLFLLYNPILA